MLIVASAQYFHNSKGADALFNWTTGSTFVLALACAFFIPLILAQKDLRRLADLEPFFSLLGFAVTAVFKFTARLYSTICTNRLLASYD